MFMLTHMITSFIASAGFGVLFNAPKKSLLKCGFVGMVGWFVYIWLVNWQYDAVISSLIAAFTIAVISQIFAKMYKTPIIIFSVAGIIPLVPGGLLIMQCGILLKMIIIRQFSWLRKHS